MDNKEHKKDTPEISVIIPAFNRESFIPSLIQQIKNQTLINFECIIVDDGSVDQTGKLCDSLTAGDERFVVKHTSNHGVSHARNVALDIARGNYITFVDSDDSIPEDYLEKLLNKIKAEHVDMVIGSFSRVYADGRTEKFDLPFEDRVYTFEELLPEFAKNQKDSGVFGWCCAKLFSLKQVSTNRFDESLRLAEDFDFYLRLYPGIHEVYFDNSCKYGYYSDTENSSMRVDDDDIDYLAQLRLSIRYKSFLEKAGAFYGENERIVTEQIQNYIFFALYHCTIERLKETFIDAYNLYSLSEIKPIKRNGFQGIVLKCVQNKNEKVLVFLMRFFRASRKILKGH